jgi:hypothetical protein
MGERVSLFTHSPFFSYQDIESARSKIILTKKTFPKLHRNRENIHLFQPHTIERTRDFVKNRYFYLYQIRHTWPFFFLTKFIKLKPDSTPYISQRAEGPVSRQKKSDPSVPPQPARSFQCTSPVNSTSTAGMTLSIFP